MNYSEVYSVYDELKKVLALKKECIVKRNLEQLTRYDEDIVVLCERIGKFNLKNTQNDFSEEEKKNLRKLGEEIKKVQKNNEILINRQLHVINDMLTGILNIIQQENSSYDSRGISCTNKENIDISSITEEA